VFDANGSFLLAMFEFFIFLAYFMALWWIFGDLFRSPDLGGFAKTLWFLFIIFLPFLGSLIYLIARGSGMTQRSLEAQRRMQEAQADYIRSVATNQPAAKGAGAADQIASAKSLLDSGTITQPEFDQLKAKALA
jgi:ABC-type multidrug transport system fused ATPase/permease subunit